MIIDQLRTGEPVFTLKINMADARAVEIAALSGIDAVWVDREHCAGDWSDTYHQILAGRAHQTDVIVRTSRGAYSDLIKPLELGAAAIMVPQIRNAADAADVARMTKFHPVGLRALDGGNVDGEYAALPTADYLARANNERLTIVQIESPEALAEVDQIAATDGIDMLFFGPGDFAHALGRPGELTEPAVVEGQRRVAAACTRAGKWSGTVCHGGTSVEELLDQGYSLINIGGDVVSLRRRFDALVASAHATRGGR